MSEIKSIKRKFMFSAAIVLSAVVLAVAALSYSSYVPVQAASDTQQPAKRTINVGGQGTINASPDIAYVTLGVVTENKDAKTAQMNNAASMDKVISLIKASGIKSEDIKTVNYSIYPKYDYNKSTGESNIVGYTVNNSVQVTVRDLTKTGNVIDLAAGSGANISNNISFGLSDYEKYYNDALKEAVDAAKKRAGTIAGSLGIKLDVPVSVSENGGYSPPVYNYGMYDMKAESAASAPTPIQAGSLEIKANVNMVYEY